MCSNTRTVLSGLLGSGMDVDKLSNEPSVFPLIPTGRGYRNTSSRDSARSCSPSNRRPAGRSLLVRCSSRCPFSPPVIEVRVFNPLHALRRAHLNLNVPFLSRRVLRAVFQSFGVVHYTSLRSDFPGR